MYSIFSVSVKSEGISYNAVIESADDLTILHSVLDKVKRDADKHVRQKMESELPDFVKGQDLKDTSHESRS